MHAAVPVARHVAHVAAENVLLHPVQLKVSKGDAVPQANHREGVPRAQRCLEEFGGVAAPEVPDPLAPEPRLEEISVAHGGQVALLRGVGPQRPEVGHRRGRGRGDPERQVLAQTVDEAGVKDLPHPRGLGPQRVARAVGVDVLQRRRREVGRQMGRGEVRPDGERRRGRDARRHRRARHIGGQLSAAGRQGTRGCEDRRLRL